MLMSAHSSCLLVIDVQERLAPVMTDPRRVIRNCGLLMRAARRLGVPTLLSEQYPKGLGPTVPDLRELMPEGGSLAKLHFAASADPEIAARLAETERQQMVLAGIELHVCVQQSALELKASGREVFVVRDACASRRAEDERLAEERLRQAGVGVVSVEMVLFEWLRIAGRAEFKELSALIR